MTTAFSTFSATLPDGRIAITLNRTADYTHVVAIGPIDPAQATARLNNLIHEATQAGTETTAAKAHLAALHARLTTVRNGVIDGGAWRVYQWEEGERAASTSAAAVAKVYQLSPVQIIAAHAA